MPELPEVQTICDELKPHIKAQRIIDIKILRADCIGYPSRSQFIKNIKNKTIKTVARKGKYLIFHLSDSLAMVIHLRLSGQLLIFNHNVYNPPKYERIRFYLANKKILSFVEPRVLGRVYLIKNNNIPDVLKGLKTLGLEPIDKKFNAQYLYQKIKHRTAAIKTLLLDQSIAAGVGNIYSDEALFIAGIHPLRRANTLSECEIKKLTKALKHVIASGIKSKGTTVSDYLRPDGSEGTYQFRSFVFAREGEPCRICQTPIAFAKIQNRRTRFCPNCQKLAANNN
ncbi:MAG: DNA-formamidopyrimidine glycosylase [candidate division WOR-3 bacterium]|nr:DNA-formamidopyrimidine glycosylase [candidate division WOR-3 bacterium]